MRLSCGAPRYICSREFRLLRIKAETMQAKTADQLISDSDPCARIGEQSQAELDATRDSWALPAGTIVSSVARLPAS